MTTNTQLSTTEPKKKNKNELSKQPEQEQIHRNRDHLQGYYWGEGGEYWGKRQRGPEA